MRAAPFERIDERVDRRAVARPRQIVRPEIELGLVVALRNAGRGAEVGAVGRHDRGDERFVYVRALVFGQREQPRVDRRDLADDVSVHPRHDDERRAEPFRIGDKLG
jgi:hypothetical protein